MNKKSSNISNKSRSEMMAAGITSLDIAQFLFLYYYQIQEVLFDDVISMGDRQILATKRRWFKEMQRTLFVRLTKRELNFFAFCSACRDPYIAAKSPEFDDEAEAAFLEKNEYRRQDFSVYFDGTLSAREKQLANTVWAGQFCSRATLVENVKKFLDTPIEEGAEMCTIEDYRAYVDYYFVDYTDQY